MTSPLSSHPGVTPSIMTGSTVMLIFVVSRFTAALCTLVTTSGMRLDGGWIDRETAA